MRDSRLGALLTALVFLFGVEMARFQFGSLGWYQRDTLGVGAIDLIPVAMAPILAGLLLPAVSRVLTLRYSMGVGVVVLVVARFANQMVDDPAIDHWTSAVAVAAFVGLLPLLLSLGRESLVGGVLVGVALDSAIKAAGSSLDLAYQPSTVSQIVVVAVSAVIVYLTATVPIGERAGPRWGPAATLIGLGPFLFVQYLVLQSPGWIAELAGVSTSVGSLGITVLNLVGIWAAYRYGGLRLPVAVAAVAVAAAVTIAEGPSYLFVVLAIVGIPAASVLWAGLVPETRGRAVAAAAVTMTLGMVVFLLIGFAYYLPLDLRLGFSQAQARIGGAVILLGFGLFAAARRRPPRGDSVPVGVPSLAALLLVLPVIGFAGTGELTDAPEEGPVRYMSYNLHQAFATGGEMNVDSIARVILDSDASVVGLQEVARGGLLNANTDLIHLLGERLGWEHVAFFGTTDPVWGNAILSRYPIGDVERRLLPTVDTPYQRGYLAAPVSTPEGDVLFISTHLQHINDTSNHDEDPEADLYPVHTEQLATVIEQWAGREPAVLVGDLNARPDWRQVEELLAAGWVDAWSEKGTGQGYTSNAADPRHRIDYVFHTPDLTTVAIEVPHSQASDHFPVVADLTLAETDG